MISSYQKTLKLTFNFFEYKVNNKARLKLNWSLTMFPNQLENQITNNLGLSNPQLAQFCQKWGIIELSLFGSILGNKFHQGSDIDILLQFSPNSRQGLLTLAKIKHELEKMTGRVIDIAVKESIENSENEIRRQEILKTAKVIYAQR